LPQRTVYRRDHLRYDADLKVTMNSRMVLICSGVLLGIACGEDRAQGLVQSAGTSGTAGSTGSARVSS
jgi:hypothetical protein